MHYELFYYLCTANALQIKENELMAHKGNWQDEYWLLLMELYLKRPQGLKAMYSKSMVNLALELHIHPKELYERMFRLRDLDTPRLEALWERYARNPNRLAKGVRMLRQMKGLGSAGEFFDGVETVVEPWESDFKEKDGMMPIKLIMILDLYFRLIPSTMVEETPEVRDLARLIKMKAEEVVEVMKEFWREEREERREERGACREVWARWSGSPEKLATYASQLREYFQ